MNVPDHYKIEHERGERWWDLPYYVTRNGTNVGVGSMTFWGARWAIRKDKRKRRMGVAVVWEEGER